MTGESSKTIYPQYCFHLSPTIEKWCRFRAREIHDLSSHRGFEGQDLYFHLNHPIKWVQVAGLVVAIDEWPGRRIYTVDDSSGATIECVLNVPKHDADLAAISATAAEAGPAGAIISRSKKTSASALNSAGQEDIKAVVDGEIDVGDILLVKGNITVFRNAKQIRVYKIIHLRCTEDEVRFWNKMTEFNTEVLSKPWTLTEKELRRCRREATRPGGRTSRENRRTKRKAAGAEGLERTITRTNTAMQASTEDVPSKVRLTGLERTTMRVDFVDTEATGMSRIPSVTPAPHGAGTSKTRVTGLERHSTRVDTAGTNSTSNAKAEASTLASDRKGTAKPRVTGLERKPKRTKTVDVEGKYSALGI